MVVPKTFWANLIPFSLRSGSPTPTARSRPSPSATARGASPPPMARLAVDAATATLISDSRS
jgi:hypothetical protein